MGNSNSSSTPQYAQTNFDSDIWGSSTNGSTGTSYKPADWMTDTMKTVTNNYNTTLNNMLNNDFANDPNFQAYQDRLNREAQESYDASVLAPLAKKGLMRSSGLQKATNSFADALAEDTVDLYDDYYNRQSNNLANMLNTSNNLYKYMTGLTSGALNSSNAVNNFNVRKSQLENSQNQSDNNLLYKLLLASSVI